MGKTKDSLTSSLENADALKRYLIKKGENHKNYKTYSSQKFIREIINEQRIYLNDGSNWNDIADRKAFNSDEMEYKIVGSTEVDCLNNKISNESPVGAALIGAAKGDIIEIETPNGEMIKYEVMSVSR